MYSSVALYNACNQDAAQLYDHGLGHLVPRDADNVEQLGDTLSDVITRINKDAETSKEEELEDEVPAPAPGAQALAPEFVDGYATTTESSGAGSSSAGSTAETSDLDSRSSHGLETEIKGIAKIQVA